MLGQTYTEWEDNSNRCRQLETGGRGHSERIVRKEKTKKQQC